MEAIATQGRSYGEVYVGACLSRDGRGGGSLLFTVFGLLSAAADPKRSTDSPAQELREVDVACDALRPCLVEQLNQGSTLGHAGFPADDDNNPAMLNRSRQF